MAKFLSLSYKQILIYLTPSPFKITGLTLFKLSLSKIFPITYVKSLLTFPIIPNKPPKIKEITITTDIIIQKIYNNILATQFILESQSQFKMTFKAVKNPLINIIT